MKFKDITNRITSHIAGYLTRAAYKINDRAFQKHAKRLVGAQEYTNMQNEAENAARAIFSLPSKYDDNQNKEALVRLVAGQLRSSIHTYGPITKKQIGSAAQRIGGELHAHRFKL